MFTVVVKASVLRASYTSRMMGLTKASGIYLAGLKGFATADKDVNVSQSML